MIGEIKSYYRLIKLRTVVEFHNQIIRNVIFTNTLIEFVNVNSCTSSVSRVIAFILPQGVLYQTLMCTGFFYGWFSLSYQLSVWNGLIVDGRFIFSCCIHVSPLSSCMIHFTFMHLVVLHSLHLHMKLFYLKQEVLEIAVCFWFCSAI